MWPFKVRLFSLSLMHLSSIQVAVCINSYHPWHVCMYQNLFIHGPINKTFLFPIFLLLNKIKLLCTGFWVGLR